jgi:hypothetical protein
MEKFKIIRVQLGSLILKRYIKSAVAGILVS